MRKAIALFLILMSPSLAKASITAIWANTGEDKVTRDELRATNGTNVKNSVWDGAKISIFGGRNEVVAFNTILESASGGTSNVTVSFNQLTGPSGASISASATSGNGVFNWTGRNIELFYVRYLQINGVSQVSYPTTVDERQVPRRFQRPWSGNGTPSGGWTSRPDHNKFYPEIAVPLELVPTFNIAAGQNQSIWSDIYIPKNATPGVYQGNVLVKQNGTLVQTIPVQLTVYNFTLPDMPNAKTMLDFGSSNINQRFLGSAWVSPTSAAGIKAKLLRDRYVMLAHRHRISMIGDNLLDDCGSSADQPCPEWTPRLNGSLFTSANGYDGPGVNTGNNVYSIGTYGSWSWNGGTQADMNTHTNNWATWFNQNAPGSEYFLYLNDESTNYTQTQNWAQWIKNNPGIGNQVKSLSTLNLPTAATLTPSLDIPTSTMWEGVTSQWQTAADSYTSDFRKRFYMYNGHRPASGSFATEDDGIALRELAWGQYKKHINRWFFWEATYYNNDQGGTGQTNVFQSAHTFGGKGTTDSIMGETGWNYSNGDGVLMYPGTDTLFPADSYGVDGPFASLRLKHWRRGIQDVDYLTMAAAVNSATTQNIVNQIVPKVLWEYGVDNPSDPTYVHAPISWSDNPDVWEAARAQLANILAPTSSVPTMVAVSPSTTTLPAGTTQQFTAVLKDQMGQVIPTTFNWSATGGNVSSNGIFTPTLSTGTCTVIAQSGNLSGAALVTVVNATQSPLNPPSTIAFNYPNPTTLRLTWGVPVGSSTPSGYFIDVALDPNFTNPKLEYFNKDMGNALSVDLSDLNPGTTYYARARASYGVGKISNNTAVAAMATLNANFAVASVPINVTQNNPTSTSVSLSWAPSTAFGSLTVATYQVQVSSNPTFSDFAGDPWSGSFYAYPATSMTKSGLAAGVRYYARVRALDAYGNASNYGSPILMNTPSSIWFNYPNTTSLRLYWNAPAGGVTAAGYRLDLATDPGFVNSVPGYVNKDMGNILSENLTNLTPATTYYARARAYDSVGNISANTPVTGMATLNSNFAAMSTPRNVGLGFSKPNSLTLSWSPSISSGSFTVANYQVQVSSSITFSNFSNDPWSGLFYPASVTNMSPNSGEVGVVFYTRVRALDAYGNASNYAYPSLRSMGFVSASAAPGGSAHIYPNPWQSAHHQGAPITFDQLGLNSTIKIFTVSGRWVETLDAPTGIAQWDLKTDDGDNAASGLYIYLAKDAQGQTYRGKFAVIR